MPQGSDIFIEGPGYRVTGKDVELRAVRSSGPGGQNVNKVSTKVVLRFHLALCDGLSPYVRNRLYELFHNQISGEGDLILTSDRYRDQPRNLDDALDKLEARLRQAAARSKPRRRTRTPRSVRENRLKKKKRRGQTKKLRRGVDHRDWD